jgi:hypothetical protein
MALFPEAASRDELTDADAGLHALKRLILVFLLRSIAS